MKIKVDIEVKKRAMDADTPPTRRPYRVPKLKPWFSKAFFQAFIGALLAALGGLMGLVGVSTVREVEEMRSWIAVPAFVDSVELIENRHKRSSTYEVRAAYSYTVKDRVYRASRVSVQSLSDGAGRFNQTTYANLKKLKEAGQPTTCYVNPAMPWQAVLFRGADQGLLLVDMVLAAGGLAGLGMIVLACRRWRTLLVMRRLIAAQKDKPWLWRPEWIGGKIQSSTGRELRIRTLVAGIWNALSIPAASQGVFVIRNTDSLVGWWMLAFSGIGIGLLVWVVICWVRWFKFGSSVFEMSAVPGVIGGELGGVVKIPVHVKPEDGFDVALVCNYRVTRGAGKRRHTTVKKMWEESVKIQRELLENDPARSAVPVLFKIPHGLPPSDSWRPDDLITWNLRIGASVPGLDYRAVFEVPVFETGAGSPDPKADENG